MAKNRRHQVHEKKVKQQQKQLLWVVGGVAVVAILAVLALIFLNRPAPLPEGIAEAYVGIDQGVNEAGYPRLGQADAPIIVEEFSSFGCPHCKDLHETQFQAILDDVRAGNVQVVFKPIGSIGGADADDMARAALCAIDEGKFWEMHDVVFNWQGAYDISTSRVESAAQELGISADATADCYNSNQKDSIISLAEREFQQHGFTGTPGVLVNGAEVNWTALASVIADRKAALNIGG